MAGFSTNFRSTVYGNNIAGIDRTVVITSDAADQRSLTIPAGSDLQVLLAFTLATLKGYAIQADGDALMQTNSPVGTGTAGDDLTLDEEIPLVWYEGCGYDKHFNYDVTTLYFTNSGSEDVVVDILILKDSSPAF